MPYERVEVRPPRGRRYCNSCGGDPITVTVYSPSMTVCLDERCVARIMGLAYDGGPRKEKESDQNRTAPEGGRILAPRITPAVAPKPRTLLETLYSSSRSVPIPSTGTRPRKEYENTKLTALCAWRAWVWRDGGLWSIGTLTKQRWPEKVALEAECNPTIAADVLGRPPRKHRRTTGVPAWACSCGIWGMRPEYLYTLSLPSSLRSSSPDLGFCYLLGTVALWGKVVTHQMGYRAQYAYPLQIFAESGIGDFRPLLPQMAMALKSRYGVLIGSPEEAAILLGKGEVK